MEPKFMLHRIHILIDAISLHFCYVNTDIMKLKSRQTYGKQTGVLQVSVAVTYVVQNLAKCK